MTKLHRPLSIAALSLLLAACGSAPLAPTSSSAAQPLPAAAVSTTAPQSGAAASATPASTVKTVTLPPHLDPRSSLASARSVYFEFDDAAVKTEYSPLVETHGRYLAAHPSLKIRVEGNADDRGSAEYNLALGQKRAQAVLRALVIYGVRTSQVEAVSWGEEKPVAGGQDESARAQNRRADLRYAVE